MGNEDTELKWIKKSSYSPNANLDLDDSAFDSFDDLKKYVINRLDYILKGFGILPENKVIYRIETKYITQDSGCECCGGDSYNTYKIIADIYEKETIAERDKRIAKTTRRKQMDAKKLENEILRNQTKEKELYEKLKRKYANT